MPGPSDQDRVRHQLSALLRRRAILEAFLRGHRTYLRASLLERYLGRKDGKRKTPAYYLCRSILGKSRFRHVPKEHLGRVRKEVAAYQEFVTRLAELDELAAEIQVVLKRLAEVQEDKDYGFGSPEGGGGGEEGR